MSVLDFINNQERCKRGLLCLDGLNEYMDGLEDEVASIVRLNPLMQALRANQITELVLEEPVLFEWNEIQIRAFFGGLKDTNIATLSVESNELYKWNEIQIRAFTQGLKASNIATLSLARNNLGAWDKSKIQTFFDGLKGTKITTLDFSDNYLFDQWVMEQIEDFAKGVRGTGITTLNLSDNYLNTEDPEEAEDRENWNNFCDADIKYLAQVLSNTGITTLNLSDNNLGGWDQDQFTAFIQGLKGSQINTLDLGWNWIFGEWDWNDADNQEIINQQITNLVQAVSDTNITMINLQDNALGGLEELQFTAFIQGVLGSQIRTLALGWRDTDSMTRLIKNKTSQIRSFVQESETGEENGENNTEAHAPFIKIHKNIKEIHKTIENGEALISLLLSSSAEEWQQHLKNDFYTTVLSVVPRLINLKIEQIKHLVAGIQENQYQDEDNANAEIQKTIDIGEALLLLLLNPEENDRQQQLRNYFYTTLLTVATNDVMSNLDAIEEYLDKVTYISDDDAALIIASGLVCQPSNRQLGRNLFYQLAKKVNLNNTSILSLYQGMLTDTIRDPRPGNLLMTADQVREEVDNKLLELSTEEFCHKCKTNEKKDKEEKLHAGAMGVTSKDRVLIYPDHTSQKVLIISEKEEAHETKECEFNNEEEEKLHAGAMSVTSKDRVLIYPDYTSQKDPSISEKEEAHVTKECEFNHIDIQGLLNILNHFEFSAHYNDKTSTAEEYKDEKHLVREKRINYFSRIFHEEEKNGQTQLKKQRLTSDDEKEEEELETKNENNCTAEEHKEDPTGSRRAYRPPGSKA